MDAKAHAALRDLGMRPVQFQALAEQGPTADVGRVTIVDRGMCSVCAQGETGQLETRRLHSHGHALAVGDFVTIAQHPGATDIGQVLPRTTVLRRAAAGKRADAQLIAANVDVIFVVAAFAATDKLERRGLQVRRMERYVAAVAEGGALPVVLLNKVDLTGRGQDALEGLVQGLQTRLHHIEVLPVSATDGVGLDALTPYLTPGSTVGFIGMSGVGKSSLINALLQRESQAVADTRGSDLKGRHTTTRRELVAMPGGVWLIDTPGMREFAVVTDGDGLAGFDDIDALAEACRFADCAHDQEPGCAVRAAVQAGDLDEDRLRNYRNLSSDAQRLAERHDAMARHDTRKKDRAFARIVREAKHIKKR